MKILLTGGTGFLGQKLVSFLNDRSSDNQVYVLVRHEGAFVEDGVNLVKGDLASGLVSADLPEEIDVVIHLAQSLRYREFPEGVSDMFAVNVKGTSEILQYALKVKAKQFIYASTGSVYPPSENWHNENAPVRGLDFYTASKLAAEQLLFPYAEYMKVVALRLFYIYGPEQTGKLVANLIESIKSGQPIYVQGNAGGVKINPTFVNDVGSIFVRAMEEKWVGTYNIANTEIVSIAELSASIGRLLGLEVIVKSQVGENPLSVIPDTSKFQALCPEFSFTSLESGLKKMLEKSRLKSGAFT